MTCDDRDEPGVDILWRLDDDWNRRSFTRKDFKMRQFKRYTDRDVRRLRDWVVIECKRRTLIAISIRIDTR